MGALVIAVEVSANGAGSARRACASGDDSKAPYFARTGGSRLLDRGGPGAGAVEHEVGVRLNARFRVRSGPGEGARPRGGARA